MKFKIVINEVWQAEHLVEADGIAEAVELADLTDDFLVERHFISTEDTCVSPVENGVPTKVL